MISMLRQGYLHKINTSKNNLNLGSLAKYSSISSDEVADGIILDSVGLSSFPDSSGSMLDKLKDKGLLVDVVKNGQHEDFFVNTQNAQYEIKTLANINKYGFHGRSGVVFKKSDNMPSSLPSSLRISFGGTKRITDAPRTAAMRITHRPLAYEGATNELVNSTLQEYKKIYGEGANPATIVVSAHSAGTPHAIAAYKLLKEKGVKSDLQLRLYEPFGAKFTGFEPNNEENVVSYRGHNSFMQDLYLGGGETIGHTEFLPPSSREGLLKGSAMWLVENASKRSVMSHTLLWMVDSHIDKANTIPKEDSLESLPSFVSRVSSQSSLSRS